MENNQHSFQILIHPKPSNQLEKKIDKRHGYDT